MTNNAFHNTCLRAGMLKFRCLTAAILTKLGFDRRYVDQIGNFQFGSACGLPRFGISQFGQHFSKFFVFKKTNSKDTYEAM